MTEEIRRRKTDDPEMDAIIVIAQALGPLDRDAAKRVLGWAEKRYTELPRLSGLDADQSRSVSQFMEAVTTTAHQVGMATGHDLLVAIARVAKELPSEVAT